MGGEIPRRCRPSDDLGWVQVQTDSRAIELLLQGGTYKPLFKEGHNNKIIYRVCVEGKGKETLVMFNLK